jgi:hypothetical protein
VLTLLMTVELLLRFILEGSHLLTINCGSNLGYSLVFNSIRLPAERPLSWGRMFLRVLERFLNRSIFSILDIFRRLRLSPTLSKAS